MPSLTTVTLPDAFRLRNEVHINSIAIQTLLWIDVGALVNHPVLALRSNATVHSVDELNALDSTVESIIVDGCNDPSFTVLNLTRFVNMKVIEVNDDSFAYVTEVHLIGLPELERVVIGMYSFTRCKDIWVTGNPDRHFYLKDCPQLRELKIGHFSFSDYAVCEIENVPSLEVIEMGELNGESRNFLYASLELKSDSERMKWWIDMPSLKSLLFGVAAFCACSRAVFESEWIEEGMMTRLAWIDFHSTW